MMRSTAHTATAFRALLESLGVAPEDLAGLSEIVELLGVSKATAFKYTRRADFPEPVSSLPKTAAWRQLVRSRGLSKEGSL